MSDQRSASYRRSDCGVLSRRAFLIIAAEATASAQADVRRTTMLKQLVKKFGDAYVENIIYNPDKALARGLSEKYRELIDHAGAATPYDVRKFGTGQKSSIYVFKESFDQYRGTNLKGKEIVLPAQSRLELTVKHECLHAETNAKGAHLGSVVLMNADWQTLQPSVRSLVSEYIAHTGTFDFYRNSPSHRAIAAGKMVVYSAQYKRVLSSLSTMSDLERRALIAISERLASMVKDVNEVLRAL